MNATGNLCYIDAHLHLQDEKLRPRLGSVLERAKEAHVAAMLCNGTDPADWPFVVDLANRNSAILPFAGLHPWRIETAAENWASELEKTLQTNVCGVGEIGLDFAKAIDKPMQRDALAAQLELAVRFGRPASIHCVKAWGELVESLKQAGPLPAGFMVHAFNGSVEVGRRLIAMGGYVSFNALSLTDNRRAKTKQLLMSLPPERILFETESPFGLNEMVTYVPRKPQTPNEPANLPMIVAEAACLIGRDANTFAVNIYENASRFIEPLRKAKT
ncbi:MAG: TatD family hydrolase [Planctomycetaceae bacterium]|nr:TatD family hydrolase [Planctomycetaceae bacterium]